MKKYLFEVPAGMPGEAIFPYVSSVVHVSNNPTWRFAYHRHLTVTDITYVVGGKGEYAIGNQWINLRPGDLIVLKPGVIHAIKSSLDDPLDYWLLAFENLSHACQSLGFDEDPFQKAYAYVGNGEAATSIGLLIEAIARQTTEGTALAVATNHLALALANEIIDFFFRSSAFPSLASNPIADGAIAFIDDRYSSKITLATLSRALHASSSSISHDMAKYYGISPIKSLIDRRIGRAEWMLVASDKNLTQIAQSVGYDDLTHFTNLFAQRTGMKPREFRDRYSEGKNET